ncbi:TIGR03067 domain-containing protein [Zavarzinella formosa]|uniref:TIGR03067 domain-containing protein n=1 Tax=Zavarzinella formosa TaxID=360055 RepID=UPI000302D6DC|nr:TIGR03067 domain-containing protein [Zavarzinella formosa]
MRGQSVFFGWVFLLFGLPTACMAQSDPIIRPVPATGIGTETLGRYLRELDHIPKALSPDVFQITIERDHWPVHVMLSLSTDGQRIWMESKFAPIEDPDQVAANAWRNLLQANDKIGPAHFAFDATDRRIHLYKSFENRAVTIEKLGKEVEQFDRTVRKTQEHWKGENFRPTGRLVKLQQDVPIMTVPPQVRPEAKPAAPDEGTKLIGEWQITGIEVKGRKTPEKIISERKPTLEIQALKNGLQAKLKAGLVSDRTVMVKVNSLTPGHHHIDFMDELDRIEKGIYLIEGDTLTVCFATPGDPRPTAFKTTEDNRNWLLTLKRAKP